ncbi:response regulator containing a CheY-like receiver domain and an HTH DNA-binding domain [Rivularia sp. PCC 7116]|uniref:response regulator transcription factor n=1 Tax=Rivularia sp. PCC 7116 TaxID=373994 RepID=UPI00029F4BFF|nr:response regulator transcription factor [Rivularia sp. PCC 7116]AFY57185.1 response regulator containing a CheY-like receiver domain and an HTH DNA-binding domain [Rivularia sp. PCC 7116]
MTEQLDSIKQKILIVDDHEAILEGTIPALRTKYPIAEIFTAKDSQTAEKLLEQYHFDLVVVDLSLPRKPDDFAKVEVGMHLLANLMQSNDAPNIVVLSTNIKPLVRIKRIVNTYEGGFAAMDKSLPLTEMLKFVDIAQRGSIYLPKEVRSRPEFDRKWLEVLTLKYQEGLSDKAIAKRMSITDRTVRNYWIRIQDALGVFDSPDKDLRVQIEIAARKAGLISN